jgi:hypothetical protein
MTEKNLSVYCPRTVALLGVPLALLLLAGCGGGSGKGSTVSGKVTYKGQPVTGGTILLHPSDGSPGDITVTIKPDGTFASSDISPGPKQISIETESVKSAPTGNKPTLPPGVKPPPGLEQQKGPDAGDTANLPKYVQIPRKYADPKTSGLTWDIGKGKNDKPFELTD